MRTLLGCLLILACAFTTDARGSENAPLGPDEWPTTVQAVVIDLLAVLPEEDKAELRRMKRSELALLHHGWGTGIRNHYGLWRGNEALIHSACGRRCHPDTASMIIIEAVWLVLQKGG